MCHPLRRTTPAAGETAAAMTTRAVEELTAPYEEGGISEMLNAIKEQNDRIIERLSTAQEEDLQTQRMKLVPQKTEVRLKVKYVCSFASNPISLSLCCVLNVFCRPVQCPFQFV